MISTEMSADVVPQAPNTLIYETQANQIELQPDLTALHEGTDAHRMNIGKVLGGCLLAGSYLLMEGRNIEIDAYVAAMDTGGGDVYTIGGGVLLAVGAVASTGAVVRWYRRLTQPFKSRPHSEPSDLEPVVRGTYPTSE